MATRKQKSLKNLIFGVLYQIINLVLNFVCRTFLIYKLGYEILGINGLYASILSFLSLADLGIDTIFVFSLYKAVAKDDKEKIAGYMNYYKKIYNIIALAVLVAGLLIAPFLNFLISPEITISDKDLYIYYFLFLASSAVSYLLGYKQTIISAYQERSVIKIFNIATTLLRTVARIILLLVIPNYKIYILAEIITNFLNNFALSIYAEKKYPFIKNKKARLQDDEKGDIKQNIKNTFLYKLGGVVLSNTSNIIISVMVSTVVVGYVSNYNTITTSLAGFLAILNSAVFASVGSITLENNNEKSLKIFRTLMLIFHYFTAFCTIAMAITFNDFIFLWLEKPEAILDNYSVLAMCGYFYLQNIAIPVVCFRENYGLFKKVKNYILITAVLNVALGILLTYFLGLVGVFLGLILSRLLVLDIMEPRYLYHEIFKISSKDYFLRQLGMFVLTAVSYVASYFLCSLIQGVSAINFIYKGLICFAITTIMFLIFTFRSSEFKYLKELTHHIVCEFKSKKSPKVKDSPK